MLPVGGRPVIDRNLSLLAESGVDEVFVNLHHQAGAVTAYCGRGDRWGLKITYGFEPQLLGTAGAVRNFGCDLGDPFFVVYGDNYFDCKFSALWKAHEERPGIATLALFERDDTAGSGVVVLDATDRVVGFREKPAVSEAPGRLVNGGLYVLSSAILPLIPDAVPCDFGYDVFPRLLRDGRPIYGRVMEGAVWGIDTPELYRELRARIGDGPA
jgi:NDP-sugar pyrophosphorylase family protein